MFLRPALFIYLIANYLLINSEAFGQGTQVLTGTVTDKRGVPLAVASVLLTEADSTSIIGFTTTDEGGHYRLELATSMIKQKGLILKVQLLGYIYQYQKVNPQEPVYNFSMSEATVELKDVIVSGKPRLRTIGDTTAYRVSDFATSGDRTIGDVLKRLPGITVEDNGLIKFNGKSVKKLYLDGDDLLDDKYNIGTRTIPQRIVEEVQVLENHQRIKALEGKLFSDDVDINLSFKAHASLHMVGQVQAGAGVPDLYDEDANALSLKSKYKSISEVKLNNTGKLLSDDVLSLYAQQTRQSRGYVPEPLQLSAGTGSNPSIDPLRYLFNNSGLLNSGNLWKFKSGLQIKSKAYYEYDRQRQRYRNQTKIYVPNDTVNYTELQNNQIKSRQAYADVNIFINRNNYYLNNSLSLSYNTNEQNTLLSANARPLKQLYRANRRELSNELNIIRSPKGKNILEYYSYLGYRDSPERLTIDSAAFPTIFLTNTVFQNVWQSVNIPTFYTNNYLALRSPGGKLKQSYKVGFSAKLQDFNSRLQGLDDQSAVTVPDSAENALRWQEYRIYTEPEYEWRSGDLRVLARLPLSLQQIISKEENNVSRSSRILFNPTITIRYDPQQGFAGSLYYVRTNNTRNILQSYSGIVLNNYRSFSQNSPIISTNERGQAGILLSYKNPVKMFFINVNGSLTTNTYNTIDFTTISKELSFTDRRLYDNYSKTFSAGLNLSKYIFAINSNITGSYSFQSVQQNQVINSVISPFIYNTNTYNLSGTGKLSKRIRYDYGLRHITSLVKPRDIEQPLSSTTISNMRTHFSLECSMLSGLYAKATANNEVNQNSTGLQANYTFTDFTIRYRLEKLKLDVQVDINNLTNIKAYQTVVLTNNTQSDYEYPLRGRNAALKVFFIF